MAYREDFQNLTPRTALVEGYVHGNANILLGSLKRWLPMNYWELPELLEIEFKAIARKKTTRPTIHKASHYSKFSRRKSRTVRELSDRVGGLYADLGGLLGIWARGGLLRNSKELAHKNNKYANKSYLCDSWLATLSKIWRCVGRAKDKPDNVIGS